MGANPFRPRLLGGWAALVVLVGAAGATARAGGAERHESVEAAAGAEPTLPAPASTATTSTTAATPTTAPPAVAVDATLPPAPTTAPPTTEPPATAPPVIEAPTTAPPTTAPPAPTFSMDPTTTSVRDHVAPMATSGDGCTGPGHVAGEYGVVGIVVTEQGDAFEGDFVAAAPGGHWDSTMWVGVVGTHQYRYRCQAADGTPVFEYAPITFVVTP